MPAPPSSPSTPSRWQRLAWASVMTAVGAVLAIGISAVNIPWTANPGGTIGKLYLTLAVPGHFLAFGALAMLPALLVGLWTRSTRPLTITAVVMQGAWLCLLLVDAKVFALYRFHLNAMVLNMVFGGALQDQVSLSWSNWLQIAGVVAAVFTAQALLAWGCWRLLTPRPYRRWVLAGWTAAVVLMAAGQIATAYYDARGERAVVSQWAYLPWAQPITAKRQMRAMGVPVADRVAALTDPKLSELAYPSAPLRCQSHQRPNVLVVVLESLRADALDPRTMPGTWALAQRSQVYDHHYSTGNATRFGLFGLLYGLPGGYWQPMLAEQRGSVLFDVLKQQGYALYLHGSAPLYSPEFDRTAFADVRELLQTAPAALSVAERDRHVVDTLRAEISSTPAGTPWFGFAFLDATHAPYHLPEGYPALDTPMAADIDFLALDQDHDATPERNRYRTAVHYADSLVSQLLQSLHEAGVEDNTIVLVTGDHAEEFNDLGLNYWGHNGNFSDHQLQVPFVLHWPAMAASRQARTSSHEDWVPTLMRHGLGCENPLEDFSTGQDLLAPAPPAPRSLLVESWSQRGIRQGPDTYVFDKFGNSTALGPDYLPLPVQQPDTAGLREAWDELIRFRRH
nr:sulfatase-like hydrolase/transferase [Stenotrophomonas chelatiphaga]